MLCKTQAKYQVQILVSIFAAVGRKKKAISFMSKFFRFDLLAQTELNGTQRRVLLYHK